MQRTFRDQLAAEAALTLLSAYVVDCLAVIGADTRPDRQKLIVLCRSLGRGHRDELMLIGALRYRYFSQRMDAQRALPTPFARVVAAAAHAQLQLGPRTSYSNPISPQWCGFSA
jgi:hypothetical protein